MALFSRKERLGTMFLSFASKQEVSVQHDVPSDMIVMFVFLYAAKLLTNFPGQDGKEVCTKGASNLSAVNDHFPLMFNESLLGATSDRELSIGNGGTARWKYSGELQRKGETLTVETKIARGEEEYLHCAAIDTALEIARRHLGAKGGAVCAAAKGFFSVLAQRGASDLRQNYQIAVSAANLAEQEATAPTAEETPEEIAQRKKASKEALGQVGTLCDSFKEKLSVQNLSSIEQISVEQLAAAALPTSNALRSDQDAAESLHVEDDVKIEAMWELLYLRFFSADFGIVNGFNDERERSCSREVVNGLLQGISQVTGIDLVGEYENRLNVYGRAVSSESDVPMTQKIAQSFAALCGPSDIELIGLGADVAHSVWSEVLDLVKTKEIDFGEYKSW